jgi:hypothetical protein
MFWRREKAALRTELEYLRRDVERLRRDLWYVRYGNTSGFIPFDGSAHRPWSAHWVPSRDTRVAAYILRNHPKVMPPGGPAFDRSALNDRRRKSRADGAPPRSRNA